MMIKIWLVDDNNIFNEDKLYFDRFITSVVLKVKPNRLITKNVTLLFTTTEDVFLLKLMHPETTFIEIPEDLGEDGSSIYKRLMNAEEINYYSFEMWIVELERYLCKNHITWIENTKDRIM